MEHPIDISKLSPQLQKICGPDAPLQLKTMAAAGVAPLKPADLATVLYFLSYDSDASLAKKATASFGNLPDNILLGVVEQLNDSNLLDGIALLSIIRIEVLKKILLNKATDFSTVVWIIENTHDDETLEIAAANQDRILKHPSIIEALYHNKAARMSTVDRAVELAIRNGLELTGIPCIEEIKAALSGIEIPAASATPTNEDRAFVGNITGQIFKELSDEIVDNVFENESVQQEEQKEKVEKAKLSLSSMNISAKIRVATLGSSTQRSILIRDSNKLVVMAVVKSPALNDSEVLRFAKFRTLPEEAVRYIAGNREWTKHYSVKLSLVQNPRCPLEYTLRFLSHVRMGDLKILARDKNVPQSVARAAKQLLTKRTG